MGGYLGGPERGENRVEHEGDERGALALRGALADGLVVIALPGADEALDRHMGEQCLPAGQDQRLPEPAHPTVAVLDLIRAGLPVSVIDRLKGALEVSETQLASVLAIPHRTLVRRRGRGVLRQDEGDRAATVARVLDRALSYFDGERRHALEWLKHPNPAVGGDTPLEHAGTLAGAEEVIDLIGRLEHGIPS